MLSPGAVRSSGGISSLLNGKLPATTSLTPSQQGVIDLHGLKIVYGTYPLTGFSHDSASGGYKASINIASHKLTGNLWGSVTSQYPLGHPYVSIGDITSDRITLLSDVNVSGAYAMWTVVGISS